MLKNLLEIFIVTYNRAEKLERTFEQIFGENSPIKDFQITVLNNNSTDNTDNVIKKYQEKFSNLKHIKHNFNIGANANIARAYELASKDYIWILADDDFYDFSSWHEVEEAVSRGEKMIMVAKYALPSSAISLMSLIGQATFTPSIILSTTLLDDTVLRNIYDNIYTMYVQLVPVVMGLNAGTAFSPITGKSIVDNGEDYGANIKVWSHSMNYHRGADEERLWFKSANMSQVVGVTNILEHLNNHKLKQIFMDYHYESAMYYFKPFSKEFTFFADLWVNMTFMQKLGFIYRLFRLDKIFCIYKTPWFMNIQILGIKTHLWKRKPKDSIVIEIV